MPNVSSDSATTAAASRLGEVVADAGLRDAYVRFLRDVASLHPDLVLSTTDVDVRAEIWGRSLCRVVPYRDVVHLLVGESPVWEARLRHHDGVREAFDLVLRTFVRMASTRGGGAGTARREA